MFHLPNARNIRCAAARGVFKAAVAFRSCAESLRQKDYRPALASGTTKTVAAMDRCIHFMMQRDYASPNPAIAIARAPIVIGLWVILALAFIIVFWGALAPIDSAVIARGSIVLSSNRKTIQHLEGGIINEIFVKDGDKVAAGQKLLALTNTAANVTHDSLTEQLYDARAAEARLKALLEGQNELTPDSEMTEAAKTNPVVAKIIETQTSLFKSEKEAQQAKIATLGERIAQQNAEITGIEAQKDSLGSQLALVEKELSMVQELLKSGYATKPRLYALQKSQSELTGNQGQLAAQALKAQQGIAELETAMTNQQREFEAKSAESLREAQTRLAELSEKMRATHDIMGRTTITAPAAGIVMGLKYHTPGGVIASGAPIMEIVPQDDPLVVEVRVNPTDIGSVHAGMDAHVMFTAYKARRTPKIPAVVTQVSADTLTEERSNMPYYSARLEIDKDFLGRLKKPIDLYPGSPVNVFIRKESRTFLNYLFAPIIDSTQKAFREE